MFSLLEGFERDPKHVVFTFSRYKFVAKMLQGLEVLEIGAGDCVASLIVKQVVKSLVCIDIGEELFSQNVDVTRLLHDITEGPFGSFEAAYALDVMEHIKDEDAFLKNVVGSLKPGGIFIVGMPSLESQVYASDVSKKYHVNCKTQDDLRETLKKYFKNVFCFSMNDEVLHTGFGPMSHYLLALCLL